MNGVTLAPTRTPGGTIFLRFRDPRISDPKKRQRFPSSFSSDKDVAKRIADDLSRIINNRDYWESPPDTMHARAKEIWGAESIENRARQAAVKEKRKPGFPDARKVNHSRLIDSEGDYEHFRRAADDAEEVQRLLAALEIIKKERDNYRDRNRELEGMLKKMGHRVLREQSFRPFKEALDAFLDERTGGTKSKSKGWRKILRYWCERLGEEYGMDQDVNAIEPARVIKHLTKLLVDKKDGDVDDCPNKVDTVRRTAINIAKFLEWSTNGGFNGNEVRNWAKNLANDDGEDEWFWLERKQVKKLVARIRKTSDYWADVALIQHACGFRPEEMALLQKSKVTINREGASIALEPVRFEMRIVRRLKTLRSRDTINVPSWAIPTLRRIVKGAGMLLFPRNAKAGESPKWSAHESYERKMELWPSADAGSVFSRAYRARLKEAAEAIKVDASKINSRTMRHTCARELVLAHGFDRAAAVLRDNAETLRKHYADLQARDVDAERTCTKLK